MGKNEQRMKWIIIAVVAGLIAGTASQAAAKPLKEPILIIKTAWGGKSLHTDFRSPGAGPYGWSDCELSQYKDQSGNLEKSKTDPQANSGDLQMKIMAEFFTPEEWKRVQGLSNHGFHDLGAAKIMAPIGKAIAEAIVNLPQSSQTVTTATARAVLDGGMLQGYVETFNKHDNELYTNAFPNAKAVAFLQGNVPLFDCPDEDIRRTYYFRWWTFRKHVKQTPDGWVVTEFLPQVPWSGKHNAISCPAGHHFREGRWIHDRQYLDDYGVFWFRKGGSVRSYSFWAADSIWSQFLVTGNDSPIKDLLPDLISNYEEWEKDRRDPNGLFWQIDDRDGMEISIGGSGYRATINSYMYGDAVAITKMAGRIGKKDLSEKFRAKALEIRRLTQEKLWDDEARFFKVLPRGEGKQLADVREEHGLTPWYFHLPEPDKGYEVAWKQLMDPNGFYAPYGPTSAERRHPGFKLSYQSPGCQGNGPSWRSATAVPLTGEWIARDVILDEEARRRKDGQPAGLVERGKDYNHSSFCDLVITGLVGLHPRSDDIIEVNPLVPDDKWDFFCLDDVLYHGRSLTIIWDKTGTKYGRGAGLSVLVDGKRIAHSLKLGKLTADLPELKAKLPL